jgi:hypothetical protein
MPNKGRQFEPINDPAYPEPFDPWTRRPRPLRPWRPMSEFDPAKPAILHDELNENEFLWTGTGERYEHWCKFASQYSPSVIEWDGLLIDRWREPTKQ